MPPGSAVDAGSHLSILTCELSLNLSAPHKLFKFYLRIHLPAT